MTSTPKTLPCKYFYDDTGSEFFDRICGLPEYYLTRSESSLLHDIAGDIADRTQAEEILELGSGVSLKTAILLDAFFERRKSLRYIPVDISEAALKEAISRLKDRYPSLEIEAVVCDYTKDLSRLSPSQGNLSLFLGSTIGNFLQKDAIRLLVELRKVLHEGDWYLMGMDLMKAKDVIEPAYNDAEGLTACFNRNILTVINRRLGADFDPKEFRHRAFLDRDAGRVELHLEAGREMTVYIRDLDLIVPFRKGETILTEISRKFTRSEVVEMLAQAGFELDQWYVGRDGYFALALARASNRCGMNRPDPKNDA